MTHYNGSDDRERNMDDSTDEGRDIRREEWLPGDSEAEQTGPVAGMDNQPVEEEPSSGAAGGADPGRISREESYRADMPGAAGPESGYRPASAGEPVNVKRSSPKPDKPGRSRFGWLQTIGGGVVGSVLTLAIAVPFLDHEDPAGTSQPAKTSVQSESQTANPVKVSSDGSLADMVEQASGSIFGIVNYQQQQQQNPFSQGSGKDVEYATGSGVLIKKDNGKAYIVTNNHVVEGASKLEVSLANGERAEAELVGADALSDLAVVSVDADKIDAKPLKFGDSEALRAGDSVVAIGNPLGLQFSRSVTEGIISAVDRSISVDTSAGEWEMSVIQTDAAINQGNSGGALINMNGEVVGINSLKIGGSGVEGLGFAIPSNDVMPLVEEMMAEGHVERPYIGISMYNVNEIPRGYVNGLPNDVSAGVYVAGVDPDAAAAKAGLKEGDVITEINGEKIEDGQQLRRFLYSELKVGDKATVSFYRDGKKQEISVTLGTSKPSTQS
ncbi:S1C family serine protease [Edaphobacillus lindanitolerans]|uniref:HtrA-like peptidase. Serine peptidase. MEROPS family S01B n=1 Tax=Edaphobacillus lindanitolerans TaxID=550447 RepID=A0A1U7PNB7_9BACI|nr:trypsin-like peptidase domain-containing protein [Edaphobacillus lindanitolerans]SIT87297.1 htrA-like peptidase. Serine peptidase. MEROPS family S01B [Edaphobacillus lindanitolerans]